MRILIPEPFPIYLYSIPIQKSPPRTRPLLPRAPPANNPFSNSPPPTKPPKPKPLPQMSISTTTIKFNSSSSTVTTTAAKKTKPAAKRLKHRHSQNQELEGSDRPQSLLPGLPDHIAQICLSLVSPSTLYSICKSWRCLIYSPSFPPFLSIYALLLPTQNSSQSQDSFQHSNSVKFSCFDPISSKWFSIPPPPPDPPLHFLLRHPSFISRRLPIQSVGVSGKLVLLAATADQFQPALGRPLIFDPLSKSWSYGPLLSAPRRWCAAGSSAGVVYVASGVGSHYNQDIARSAEKWDLQKNLQKATTTASYKRKENNYYHDPENSWKWEKMVGLKDGKFSRDAIDAVGWRGKLCMVNVKGDAAKEGIIYDVKNDAWEEMPAGMLVGWRGPAASMGEETIYMVNESKGLLREYDPKKDSWVDVFESKMLQGAQHVAAGGGRVCVVGGSAVGIVVVEVTARPCRVWVVDTPPGFQAVSIHVLPRMSQREGYESTVLDSMCEE